MTLNPEALTEEEPLKIIEPKTEGATESDAFASQRIDELFSPGIKEPLSPTVEQNEPMAYGRVYRSGSVYEIGGFVAITIAFNTQGIANGTRLDYGLWGSDLHNNYRITILRKGIYAVTAQATIYVPQVSQFYKIGVMKNGVEFTTATSHASVDYFCTTRVTEIVSLEREDYIQATLYHESTGFRSVGYNSGDTFLHVHQIA